MEKRSSDLLFKQAKHLYNLGFGILWLHPKSKRPVENGWASGSRQSWGELQKTFVPGYNVGVRLGSASLIGKKGYLAVIDVDIKSKEPKHRKQAEECLKSIIGSNKLLEVCSGRGNGSRHLYCLTEKPFKTWNPFSSKEKVKVFSPSKAPSKQELETLTEKEIKKGVRLSRAWEISNYSEGRQVVLPPSIHPDTGKPYFWVRLDILAETDFSYLPMLNLANPKLGEEDKSNKPKPKSGEALEDFDEQSKLDVRWLPNLSESIRALIVDGIWKGQKITDRSSHLLTAATGLLSAGLSKNEILSVLTDKSTFLGECAYDHVQSNSRKRAAKWVWEYSVKKVLDERDAKKVFLDKAVITTNDLSVEEAKAQSEEFQNDTPIKQELECTKDGRVRSTLNNCRIILQRSCKTPEIVGRDEFAVQDYYLCDTPWRSKKGEAVTDIDIVRIKFFCVENFGVEFGDNIINQALLNIADVNRFHPVREYLKGLKWDGTPRIESWLKDYAGAEGPEEYLRAVSTKVLVAMIKRVMEPGCKFDHVLILEGNQGVGKSTLLAKLAGKWFSDQPLVIGDKDSVLTMQSKWLIELGELSSLNRSEVESMKAFISQRVDRIRAPYGKRMEEYPRQCIFIGSTNLEEYLKDESGNRRFWPVRCGGKIDFEAVEQIRDQLFAEAMEYWRLGEPLYLEKEATAFLAKAEQESRNEYDEWTNSIKDVLASEAFPRNGFEMRQLAMQLTQFNASRLEKADQMRIAKILKKLGYCRYQEKTANRRRLWGTTKWVEKYLKGSSLFTDEKLAKIRWSHRNHIEGGSEPVKKGKVVRQKSPMILDFY